MKKIGILLLIACLFGSVSHVAYAADFLAGSNKGEVLENDTFDVSVYINSDGTAINSAEGTISFPSDLVSVLSVNTSGSIFPVWVEQPTYSNSSGVVSFNGGIPNPGFTGSRGTVARIIFKAKKAGNAAISFGAGGIYSNDGSGTDVLKGKKGVTVSIGKAAAVAVPVVESKPEEKQVSIPAVKTTDPVIVTKPAADAYLPPMPRVSSKDALVGQDWFATKNITLDWDVPAGVTSVQFLFGGAPDAIPTKIYTPAVNFVSLLNVANGVSYFHIRFKNSAGWGEVLHKKIMVDTIPPSEPAAVIINNPNKSVSLSVNSKDADSGVKKYEVYEGTIKVAESASAGLEKDTLIQLPILKSGKHELKVVAYDDAKNTSDTIIEVVSPLPEAPQVTALKKEVKINEENSLEVVSYPNTEVRVYMKDEAGKVNDTVVKTDESGKAIVPLNGLGSYGTKKVWVSMNNDCADICVLSEVVTIDVVEGRLVQLPKMALAFLRDQSSGGAIPWAIAVLFIILYLLTFKRKADKDIIRELNKAEIDVYKIFKVLKADAKKYKNVIKRNKIDIAAKDQTILESLEKDLEEAETYFANRIEKIEKELE